MLFLDADKIKQYRIDNADKIKGYKQAISY